MSTRKKILIPMAAVAVVCAAIIGFLGVIVVHIFVNGFNDQQLARAHVVAATVLEDFKSNAQRASATAAQNYQLVAAITDCLATGENEHLSELSISLMEAAGVDFLTVTNADGTVLVRSHDSARTGDSLAYQSNIGNALQGRQHTTIEEGTAIKLAVVSGSPVYDGENQLIGAVSLGFRLDQPTFTAHIKNLTDTEVTVFSDDIRISTTVLDKNGIWATGTQADPAVSKRVLSGDEYTDWITVLGQKLYANYFPLRNAEGAIVGMFFVGLDTAATEAHMAQDTWIMIGVVLLLGALSVFVSGNISSRISRPIVEISGWAKQLAVGNIDIEVNTCANTKTRDEIKILANDFHEMIKTIKQQADILTIVSNGDYSVSIPVRSDHDIINQAINRLLEKNNTILSEINSSAAQVSAGSEQIATGAQALALGSGRQASAIQELSATISEIAGKTKENADIAREAAALSEAIRNRAEKGNMQMDQMMQAVEDISDASSKIESVIKVIETIAFQTKILALNAAVEAARAGVHGKGFAVVAEEVRNLAAKSAEAANDTGGLIENSILKSSFGRKIATETSASLKEIVGDINQSAGIVAQIAQSSDDQASAIAQINIGIDQVAQVVQENSITAEKSAAASEEMNGQSRLLAQLITQFKLKAHSGQKDPTPTETQLLLERASRRNKLHVLEAVGHRKIPRF